MYTYFVAYIVVSPETGQHAFGNAEIKTAHKITSGLVIQNIQDELKAVNPEHPEYVYTVQSFQVLNEVE